MAGIENLVPQSERTKEEQREIAKKGGIASGKARAKKKTMKEALEILLNMPLKDGSEKDIDKIKSFAGIKGTNITVNDALMVAQLQKALKGDTQALSFVRDTAGQKPKDTVDIDMNLPVLFGGEEDLKE